MRPITAALMFTSSLLAGCQSLRPAEDASARTPGGATPGAQRESRSAAAPASERPTARLFVKGLACPLCATNIDKQLLRVPGVRAVSVNLGTGEVLAELEPGHLPTREQLARAIMLGGLTLDRIEMPAN